MNIADVIDAVAAVQLGISIDDPAMEMRAAFAYVPDAKAALPIPAWVNSWSMPSHSAQFSNRSVIYTVHMQLFAVPAAVEQERAMRVCSLFHEQVLLAFEDLDNSTLGATVSIHTLRGNDPTMGRLEHGGQAYIGLDYLLDVQMQEARA